MFKYNNNFRKNFNVYAKSFNRMNISHFGAKTNVNSFNIHQSLRTSKLKAINGLNQIRDKRLNQNKNKFNTGMTGNTITRNNLPKPRQYDDIKINKEKQTKVISDPKQIASLLNKINQSQIQQFQKNDPLTQKETKVVDNQEQLSNLVSAITNNKQIETLQNNTITETTIQEQQKIVDNQFKYVISNQQLINKAQSIVQYLQLNIYTNPQYNYYKLIQFVHNLYQQYAENKMALMIICKGFSQFNKKQMLKIPDDKIGDIIQYIIEQIKL